MRKLGTPWMAALAVAFALAGCSKSGTETGAPNSNNKTPSGGLLSKPEITVPSGTELHVRLISSVSSNGNHAGDEFTGSLADDVQLGGKVVIPKDADVSGRVTDAEPSGRLKGSARLALTVTSITVHGKPYEIKTSTFASHEASKAKRDLIFIGGGTGGGALIGAIAGKGKGAGIGALIGAGGGTAAAMLTGKKDIKLPSETVIRFTLEQDLRLPG